MEKLGKRAGVPGYLAAYLLSLHGAFSFKERVASACIGEDILKVYRSALEYSSGQLPQLPRLLAAGPATSCSCHLFLLVTGLYVSDVHPVPLMTLIHQQL